MYRRYVPVHGCVAFVAHVQDPANYDIEIQLDKTLRQRYANAVTTCFTYSFLPDSDFVTGHDPSKIKEQAGYTYRCRLRGVGVRVPALRTEMRALHRRIQQLLEASDNYATVAVSDLDVHQRVLVDIYIGDVSLRQLVLDSGCYLPYRSLTLDTRTTPRSTARLAPPS